MTEQTNTTEETAIALTKIVNESGLQLTEAEAIKQSYLPFFNELAEIKAESAKINRDNPTQMDEMIAKTLRLRTVKVRTGSELIKDERKRGHQLKANVEQAAWNLIKATCQLEEDAFAAVEKRRENEEKARKAELKAKRAELLEPYKDIMPLEFIDLAEITETAFENVLKSAELTRAAQVQSEADAKAAAEKAAAEEQARLDAERKESERVKAELELEKKKSAEIAAAAEAEAKKASEALEAERKLQAEKDAAESAEKAKLYAEIEARKKAETDRQIKEAAEIKAKAAAEEKARKAAEKAPDREKIKKAIAELNLPVLNFADQASAEVFNEISKKLDAFKAWSNKQIDLI